MAGGKRPGAGRPKGAPNKSAQREAKIAATGATPLDEMIEAMRFFHSEAEAENAKGNAGSRQIIRELMAKAADMASKAAPYVHPRLAAIQHMGKDGGPIQVSNVHERLAALIEQESAAQGQTVQ